MPQSPEEFIHSYEEALRSHDQARVLELIDDDAVYFFSNETQHIGKSAIAEAIGRNFEIIKCEQYEMSNLRWLVKNESAVVIFDYAWSGLINGEQASGFGRGTLVLKSHGESWRIVHEHLSRGRFVSP